MLLSRILNEAIGGQRSISAFGPGGGFENPNRKRAGVKVTKKSAMQLSAVYASWRIISEAVATLPKSAMIDEAGELTLPKQLDEQPIWLTSPSVGMTWIDFIGQAMVSLLQSGDAYILIQWGKDGKVLAATVLDPTQCEQLPDALVEVTNRDNGQKQTLPEAGTVLGRRSTTEVLHVRGMTLPGALEGISPIEACDQTIGLGLAAQTYGAAFFANDATPGGLIEVPKETRLTPEAQDSLRKSWRDLFGGPDRAKNVAVLIEGATFKSLQVNPNEAQFLETRKFGVQEIARIYGLPPHLLSDTTNSTGWGTGMAEQNTAYVIHTLRPWLERLESRLSGLLHVEYYGDNVDPNLPRVYISINEEALLRGATKERWDVLRKNVAAGIMTADEARAQEGMGPLPDGLGAVPWIPLSQAPEDDDDDDDTSKPKQEPTKEPNED